MFFQLPNLPEIMVSMGDFSMIKSACKKGPTTDEDVEAFKYSMSRAGRNSLPLYDISPSLQSLKVKKKIPKTMHLETFFF